MDNFTHTRARLLKEQDPKAVGFWAIHGEDENCDLGGPHTNRLLEVVEGRYIDVVEYALNLPGFFAWGYGGFIRPYTKPEIKKIGSGKPALIEID